MFGTQKSAMPLSFSNFDFLPIYKADSAGSRTYPFGIGHEAINWPCVFFSVIFGTFSEINLF